MSPVADCEGMEHYMLLIECHWTLNKFIFVTQGGPGQPGLCGWRPAEYLESVNAMYGGSEKGTSFFWTNNNVKYLFVYVLGDKVDLNGIAGQRTKLHLTFELSH